MELKNQLSVDGKERKKKLWKVQTTDENVAHGGL